MHSRSNQALAAPRATTDEAAHVACAISGTPDHFLVHAVEIGSAEARCGSQEPIRIVATAPFASLLRSGLHCHECVALLDWESVSIVAPQGVVGFGSVDAGASLDLATGLPAEPIAVHVPADADTDATPAEDWSGSLYWALRWGNRIEFACESSRYASARLERMVETLLLEGAATGVVDDVAACLDDVEQQLSDHGFGCDMTTFHGDDGCGIELIQVDLLDMYSRSTPRGRTRLRTVVPAGGPSLTVDQGAGG